LKLSELKPCCSVHVLEEQKTWVAINPLIIAPMWIFRIVCHCCGKTSPWADSLDKAYKLWNGEGVAK